MTESIGSVNMPPDGQSEQVSVDEARDGARDQVEQNSDVRRESPDGSENPGQEPISERHEPNPDNGDTEEQNDSSIQNNSGDGQEESGTVIDEAGRIQNTKQEADDNNNIPTEQADETAANADTDLLEGDAKIEEDENDQDGITNENDAVNNEEDEGTVLSKEEEDQNENADSGRVKPAGEDDENADTDAEDRPETKETKANQSLDPTQLGTRKHTTTPADDSGLTQPALPAIPRGQAKVQQLATSISDARNQSIPHQVLMPVRNRVPPKLMRLATVTVSPAKSRPMAGGPSMYYEEPKRPQKVITWDQANNARPPLRMDMEGPGPCTYSPLNKPLNETNSPAYTFGTKCQPEKPGLGARTSWAKSWFQSSHLYHQKADYIREGLQKGSTAGLGGPPGFVKWPSPNHYPKPNTLGARMRTMYAAPSYTFGHRQAFSIIKPGAHKEPSPNDYERQNADNVTFRRGPSFSHQFRREGTVLWGLPETTPGPAAYAPLLSARIQKPAYTIQGIRREKSHVLGPYSTM